MPSSSFIFFEESRFTHLPLEEGIRNTEYGRLNSVHAKCIKDLHKENKKLKRLVADFSLDNAVLKDFALGNF